MPNFRMASAGAAAGMTPEEEADQVLRQVVPRNENGKGARTG